MEAMRSISELEESVVVVRLGTQEIEAIKVRIRIIERKPKMILRLMVHLQLVFRLL